MINLKSRLRALFARSPQPQSSADTTIVPPSEQPSIQDGIDYSLPVVVPGYVRAALTESELQKYVEAEQYRHQFGSPYSVEVPFSPATEDPLQEWAWSTRVRILTNCHAAYHRNPLINAAVQYSADFIIGDGFNLNCKNKDVENILYQFTDNPLNAVREYERDAAIDLQVDGELFLRIFEGSAETEELIRIIPMRPWECEYIKTKRGDFKTRESYHFNISETEGDSPTTGTTTTQEDITAGEIIHVGINRHAYELRGRPELYRILAWARADTEFLENRARQNFWRGALLWWVAIKNATAATIASVSSAWRRPPPPGSTVVTSDAQVVTPLTNSTGGSDASEDGQAIKNRVILGFRMPEYFFADGSDSNLATATAQQLPALTRFGAFQRTLTEQLWYPLFKRVLQTAIDEGLLPEEVEEQDSEGEPIREEPKPEDSAAAIAKSTEKRKADQQAALNAEYGETLNFGRGIEEASSLPPGKTTVTTNGATEQPPAPDGMPDMLQPDLKIATPVQGKPKKIKTLDAFEITYEPVSADDPQTLAQMLTVATQNGWASNQTAAQKLGFDYHYEKKLIRREMLEERKEMVQGLRPPPPTMQPQGMAGEPPQDGQKPQEKAPAA